MALLKFKTVFAITVLSTAMIVMPSLANDNKVATSTRNKTEGSKLPEFLISYDKRKKYSFGEAYRKSTDKIVLHYGRNIKLADLAAEALTEEGYEAIALAGGPDNIIALFVDRTKTHLHYSQDDLNSGKVGSTAMSLYLKRVGEPQKPE